MGEFKFTGKDDLEGIKLKDEGGVEGGGMFLDGMGRVLNSGNTEIEMEVMP